MVAAQVQQRTAEQLFATLGQLKGGAMKVGQAMSAMEAALPEQLVGSYREALVKLQDAAPATPASMVQQQLDRSLGTGWRQLLRDFDDRPVASASVGQVHRATWSDGTPVAVKIQYPGAGEALVADLGLLQTLTPIVQAAMPGLDAAGYWRSCARGWSRRSTTSARPGPRRRSPTPTATTGTSPSPTCWSSKARSW